MRKLRGSLCIAAVAVLLAMSAVTAPAPAVTYNWTSTDQAVNLWTDANNWDQATAPSSLTDGNNVVINEKKDTTTTWYVAVDIEGADINMPNSTIDFKGNNVTDSNPSNGYTLITARWMELDSLKTPSQDGPGVALAKFDLNATQYFKFQRGSHVQAIGLDANVVVSAGYIQIKTGNDSTGGTISGSYTASDWILLQRGGVQADTPVTAGTRIDLNNAHLYDATAPLIANGGGIWWSPSEGVKTQTTAVDMTATDYIRFGALPGNTLTMTGAITADSIEAGGSNSNSTSAVMNTGTGGAGSTKFEGALNTNRVNLDSFAVTNQWNPTGQIMTPYMQVSGPLTLNTGVYGTDIALAGGSLYDANHVDAMGGATAIVTADGQSIVQISQPQTAFPGSITLTGNSTLAGDLTGAIYDGVGQNVFLEDGSIIGGGAINAPTDANLAAAGVKVYQGVENVGSGQIHTYDSSTSQTMGLAINTLWSSSTRPEASFINTAPDEDLEIYFEEHNTNQITYYLYYDVDKDAIYESGSKVANIKLGPNMGVAFQDGGINGNNAEGNAVTTFNFIGNSNTAGVRFDINKANAIDSNQTMSFSNGKIRVMHADAVVGRLEAGSGGLMEISATLNVQPTSHIHFSDGSGRSVSTGQLASMEAIPAAKLTTSGVQHTYFSSANGTYDIDATVHPNMVGLLATSSITLNGNGSSTIGGDGLQLSDGAYVMGHSAMISSASILGAAPGGGEVRFINTYNRQTPVAWWDQDSLAIAVSFDAQDSDLVIGTLTPMLVLDRGLFKTLQPNQSYNVIIDNEILSNSGSTTIRVESGGLGLGPRSDDATTLNVVVEGGGVYQGKTRNQSLETGGALLENDLTNVNITINNGYAWLTPNNGSAWNVYGDIIVNSDWSGTNAMGLPNGGAYVQQQHCTVAGTLGGDGQVQLNGDLEIGTNVGASLTYTGKIGPGNGVGELEITGGGDLELNTNATYLWEVISAGTAGIDYDTVTFVNNGDLEIEDNWIVDIIDATGLGVANFDDVFVLFNLDGDAGVTGFDPGLVSIGASPSGWDVSGVAFALADGDITLTGLVSSLVGDADGNGVVNAADYIILKTNMGTGTGAGAAAGDFNGDGNVDWTDLQLLQDHYGEGSGASGVIPEPATLGLLAIGAIAVIRRRRRRA